MDIKLLVGVRGSKSKFEDSYQPDFLKKNGWKFYPTFGIAKYQANYITSVKTKYGELIPKVDDVLTYVGNGIWDVRKESENK